MTNQLDDVVPPLSEKAVLATMHRLLVEQDILSGTANELTRGTRLLDDLGLNSVSMLELITSLEEAFDITIDLDDLKMEILNSAGSLADLVRAKTLARA
jgi:acyl carrier protein